MRVNLFKYLNNLSVLPVFAFCWTDFVRGLKPSRKMLKNTSHLGSCRSITLSLVTATIIAHLEEPSLKKPRPGHTQEHTVQGTTLVWQKGKQP